MVDILPAALTGRMLSALDGADWTKALFRPNENIIKTPKHYFYPETNEDVASVVKWAAEHNLVVAVKGGGNNQQGASSCDDGLVIDLSKMNHISVEHEAMRIGGGCLWGEVYRVAKGAGRLVVGGGANCVGVGGFLLGGGNAWFSSLYGTGCDNILEATVVVADGRILTCNSTENSDLFWAIRGGSSQFGVVTEFVLKSYPEMGEMLVGNIIYPGTEFPAAVNVLQKWLSERGPTESLVFCLIQAGHDPNSPFIIVVNPWAIGPLERQNKVFAPFREELKVTADKTFVAPSMLEAGTAADSILLNGPPRAWVGGTPFTQLWPGMLEECKDYMLDFIKANPGVNHCNMMFEMHTVKRTDPEGTSYHVRAPGYSYLAAVAGHKSAEDDAAAQEFTDTVTGIVRKYQTANGGSDLGLIANYTSSGKHAPATVWGDSYDRLREVKRKYDPNCVFKLFHCIEPASA